MIRLGLALLVLLGGAGYATFTHSVDAQLAAANLPDLLFGSRPTGTEYAYGPRERERLSVYGASPGQRRPVVIFWHGGRWTYGNKDQYRFVARGLVDAGALAVLPNYALYPAAHLKASMQDVAAAVAFVQQHAAEWGGDPSRVILMGHSAGAQLAALATFDTHWLRAAGARPVQGFIGFAGPYDFLPLTDDDLKDYFGPPEDYAASQPINFVAAPAVPAFLVQGRADTSVWPRNTEHLSLALERVGGRVETLFLDKEGHGDVIARFVASRRKGDPVLAAMANFIHSVPPGGMSPP